MQESKEQLAANVNKQRELIKDKVDQHHDSLIDEIKSTIDSLHEPLKATKKLYIEHDSKVEENIGRLSDIANSGDYSLMTNTLANLREKFEKDLLEMGTPLPKFDSDLKCPVTVLQGEEWQSQNLTQIKVDQGPLEYLEQLTTHIKVDQISLC